MLQKLLSNKVVYGGARRRRRSIPTSRQGTSHTTTASCVRHPANGDKPRLLHAPSLKTQQHEQQLYLYSFLLATAYYRKKPPETLCFCTPVQQRNHTQTNVYLPREKSSTGQHIKTRPILPRQKEAPRQVKQTSKRGARCARTTTSSTPKPKRPRGGGIVWLACFSTQKLTRTRPLASPLPRSLK